VPEFPAPVQDAPSIVVVDNAFVTRVERGPLRTVDLPNRYLRGAVHDAGGVLVPSSQKIGGVRGHPWVPADPARAKVRSSARPLPGRWMYGGHWMQHFGHFIVETLSTLWPSEPDVVGLVFHKYLRRRVAVEPWMARLLELAGYGGLPIEVVGKAGPLRVEQLVVPSRTVVANGWGQPQAPRVWERIAAPFRGEGGPQRVYLSRSRYNEDRRRSGHKRARSTLARDLALDRAFAAAGFDVVAPEALPIDDQLRLMANARVVAGGSGSGLHLTAFAPPGTRVIEVGDDRNLREPIGLQLVVDRLTEHPHAFIRGDLGARQVRRTVEALLLTEPG
jgi:capsular polysaccharide biosynthesis protein